MDDAEHKQNRWADRGLELSLIGLLLTFGVLSPLGLLLSAIGLVRRPRGKAVVGVVLGALGTAWIVATLIHDEPLRYDSGPYGTIHCAAEFDASEHPSKLAVELRTGTPGVRAGLFMAEEALAWWATPPTWAEGEVRGYWWLGIAPLHRGTARTDDLGVARFEVAIPRGMAGKQVRFQGAVLVKRDPAREWEMTDAISVSIRRRTQGGAR